MPEILVSDNSLSRLSYIPSEHYNEDIGNQVCNGTVVMKHCTFHRIADGLCQKLPFLLSVSDRLLLVTTQISCSFEGALNKSVICWQDSTLNKPEYICRTSLDSYAVFEVYRFIHTKRATATWQFDQRISEIRWSNCSQTACTDYFHCQLTQIPHSLQAIRSSACGFGQVLFEGFLNAENLTR